MTDIYARLGEVGFPKAYVRDRILPDWWDDDLASDPGNRRLAEMAISRTLKIPLAELVDTKAALSLRCSTGVRFKHWKDADEDKLAPAVAVARRIGELLLSCAKVLPDFRLEGFAAAQLRERVLSQQQYIHFPALLRHAWDFGVPVVHLEALPKGSKRVDGMALTISGRPCIVLASSKRSPAWMIWHLAHELGHVAAGHLKNGDALDVSIDFGATRQEEKEANTYAHELLYGSTRGFKAQRHITGERLASDARDLGVQHRIWPACVVTSYGFHMEAWGTTNKALEKLGASEGGPEAVRAFLHERVDLDRLSDTDRHFFVNVTGLPE
jgi:Zn-dependent peptidase ImmA (M78 family)